MTGTLTPANLQALQWAAATGDGDGWRKIRATAAGKRLVEGGRS